MWIQSSFKDYYDVGMGLGSDPTLVYRRFPTRYSFPTSGKEVDRPLWAYWVSGSSGSIRRWNNRRSWNEGELADVVHSVVMFCGRWYPFLRLTPAALDTLHKSGRSATRFCYTPAHVDAWVDEHFSPENVEWWYGNKMASGSAREYARLDVERLFTPDPTRPRDKCNNQLAEIRCPVVVPDMINGCYLKAKTEIPVMLNGRLADVEFARVMNPHTAYQEIAMWLGSLAEPRKPIPKLDDDAMRDIKGFDKYSFRKDKKVRK